MNRDRIIFRDLVDLKELKLLFEQFSAATGFTTGLIDQATNEVLLATGWRDICVKFHRASPDSEKHCQASNRELTSGLKHAGEIRIHHCANGLVDGCTPLIINGRHWATLFTGQILFGPPDREEFRKRAQKYGYAEGKYLESLAEVPVVSEEKFTAVLRYLAHTISMIVEKGLVTLETQRESNGREALLQSVFKSAPVGIGLVVNRVFQWTNQRMSEVTGYSSAELEGQEARMLYLSDGEFERVGQEKYAQIKEKGTGSVDTQFKCKDGSIIDVHLSSTPIDQQDLNGGVTFTVLDITERNKALAAIQENEQRLALALEGADLGLYDWNMRTDEVYFSPGYFSMLGYGPTELPHTLQTWENLLHPEERKTVKEEILTIIRKGEGSWSQEFRLQAKNGQYLWILGRGKIVEFSPDGSPLRAAGTHLDITSHKIAAEKIRDREERFRELFNNMSSGVAVYAAVEEGNDFIFKDINRAGLLSSQMELHDLLGRKVTEVFPSIKDMGLLDVFHRVWKTGVPEHYPSTLYQDKRITLYVENYVCKIPSSEIVAIYEDITERKQAEEELVRSKREWERTFDSLPDIVTLQDKNLSIIRANQAACTALELSCDEIIGHHCFTLFRGSEDPCQDCPLLETLEDFVPYSREMYHEKLGKTFLVSAAPVFDEQGEFEYIIHVAKDISALKKSEEGRVRLAAAIDQASETVMITDPEGNIQYVNPAFEEITGYSSEEAIGQHSSFLSSDKQDKAFWEKMWTALRRDEVWSGHFINKKKDGSLFEEEATISPVKNNTGQIINFVAVKRDVTREVSLEKQLRQAMKMEAIGTLAGGIAHDFNNILAAVIGYGEMAKELLPEEDPARSDIEQMLKAGDRATELVKQILTFSRQGEEDFSPLKIQLIIKEALKLLRSSLPTTIQIEGNIDTNCRSVLADPTQIHQVIMNFCTNAKHAMEDGGGILTVSLSEIEVTDAETIPACPQLENGVYLKLSVRDTGSGMDESTQAKVFDPFFTTKAIGKGTGLGLSVVHGIVKQHQGEVTVESKPGQGTVFHVYLPIIDEEVQVKSGPAKELPRGSERILLVDDEPSVLEMKRRMLASLGYTVTAFSDSIEALDAYKANPDNFDLLMTDMTMPNLTGTVLAKNVLTIRPDFPIILCTGYSESMDEKQAKALGVREFILKPISKKQLAEIIRKALTHG